MTAALIALVFLLAAYAVGVSLALIGSEQERRKLERKSRNQPMVRLWRER